MSYSRQFRKTITVHYSGSKSYPASQTGGTVYYSGSTQEVVYFNVVVDTEPFDESIEDIKGGVDVLTGSVAATSAAQIASIRENSRKVGDTIISGFFKTVRSDISQQITELKTKTDALLLRLNELAKRCRDKQRAMNVDYQRLSSRYTAIFEDLNHELENRIYSIDEPVFKFARKADELNEDSPNLISIPSVTSSENAKAHSVITAALAKKQAIETIGKAYSFLDIQQKTDNLLKQCLLPGGENTSIVTPFFVMDATSGPGTYDTHVFASPLLSDSIEAEVLADTVADMDRSFGSTESSRDNIRNYFNSELASTVQSNPSNHTKRVAEVIDKLFSNTNFS